MEWSASDAQSPGFGAERSPRPEAKALKWYELLPNNQKALAELFRWLHAAASSGRDEGREQQGSEGGEQLATSVLISGDRGVGKSTILLSTRYALRDAEGGFFGQVECFGKAEAPCNDTRVPELREMLRDLRARISWLKTLDMEPLPPQANLLATLLVRVRDALEVGSERHRQKRGGPPSLLEEGLGDPLGMLERLIRDAAFMWEEFPPSGQDPLQRAQQQIKAAEIYASFRRDFSNAMDKVAKLLAEREFGHRGRKESFILVLPIDNVDRSIQHTRDILKLMRMVASPRFWFVLASGDSVFQLFLERSFQAELGEIGITAREPTNKDEFVAIARRQAAAAMRRVLPPVHRIQIDPLSVEQAWHFQAAPALAKSQDPRQLSELLKKIHLPIPDRGERYGLSRFADLFDINREGCKRLCSEVLEEYQRAEPDVVPCTKEKRARVSHIFTHAGELALSLSARTALDLWQQAAGVVGPPSSSGGECPGNERPAEGPAADGEQAIAIARDMLRIVVDESDLPAWASEQIHNRLLRRDEEDRTILDLSGRPVRRLKRTAMYGILELAPDPARGHPHEGAGSEFEVLRSDLHLRRFQKVILELHDLDRPGRKVQLPPAVTGWFMLLHDLLILARTRRVLGGEMTPYEMTPELAVTLHQTRLKHRERVTFEFWWPPPLWNTFIDFDIFIKQWRAFLYRIEQFFRSCGGEPDVVDPRSQSSLYFHLILAAWIDNVLSVAGDARGKWSWEGDGEFSAVVPHLAGQDGNERPVQIEESALREYLRHVFTRVEELFNDVRRDSRGYSKQWIARLWLERTLRLMLCPEFSPAERVSELWDAAPEGSKGFERLKRAWKWNEAFLRQHRYDLVREAIQRSETYQSMKESCGPPTGASASLLRHWLERACDTWFELHASSKLGDSKV